jgi:hypothetical protein
VVGKVTKYAGKKTSGTWYKVTYKYNGKTYIGYVESTNLSTSKPSTSTSSGSTTISEKDKDKDWDVDGHITGH